MYANFTEETCTGTGATLALAGATTDNIPFSASFADGDLVAYVVEDSGGSIKVAGVGTYVSATDDITRNDTWNYNGTVVDKNPTTNITLSGGTHTIRCDITLTTQSVLQQRANENARYGVGIVGDNINSSTSGSNVVIATDNLLSTVHLFKTPATLTKMTFEVDSPGIAGEIAKFGIWSQKENGEIGQVLYESGNILVDSTGFKSVTFSPIHVSAPIVAGFVTNSSTVSLRCFGTTTNRGFFGAGMSNLGYNQYRSTDSNIGTGWQSGAIGNEPFAGTSGSESFRFPYILFNAASI